MPARVANFTFDCDDALRVATFWSEALGRPLDPGGTEAYSTIGRRDAERTEPAWFFEKVPEPKSAKNRVHVDLMDADPSPVERLVALGASVVGEQRAGSHHWTVMQDPEGNEFCIAEGSYHE